MGREVLLPIGAEEKTGMRLSYLLRDRELAVVEKYDKKFW